MNDIHNGLAHLHPVPCDFAFLVKSVPQSADIFLIVIHALHEIKRLACGLIIFCQRLIEFWHQNRIDTDGICMHFTDGYWGLSGRQILWSTPMSNIKTVRRMTVNIYIQNRRRLLRYFLQLGWTHVFPTRRSNIKLFRQGLPGYIQDHGQDEWRPLMPERQTPTQSPEWNDMHSNPWDSAEGEKRLLVSGGAKLYVKSDEAYVYLMIQGKHDRLRITMDTIWSMTS